MRALACIVGLAIFVAWRIVLFRRRRKRCIGALQSVTWIRGRDVAEVANIPRYAVYLILAELEGGGLVVAEERPSGPERAGLPRRFYRLTPEGLAVKEKLAR